MEPARVRLPVRQVPQGPAVDLTTGRPSITPARFDPSIRANAAKFDALEQLTDLAADIGCTLPELALAFTLAHPAVTSVIIGPRTMQQLEGLMTGVDLVLADDVLDRIDEIVPPGVNLYHPDGAWRPSALVDRSLRRRPLEDRAAGTASG